MTLQFNLDQFPFEDFLSFVIKEKDEDNGVYLGRLVDFDKRFTTEWPSFFHEVIQVMKDLELITTIRVIEDFGKRKRFHKIVFGTL